MPPLSNGVTAAYLAFKGKVFVLILLFIAFVKGSIKYGLANFVNLAGILSSPVETSVFKSLKSLEMSFSLILQKLKVFPEFIPSSESFPFP